MDDNILLALFIFGFIGIVALIVRKVNQVAAKRQADYDAAVSRQREETRKWRERMYEKSKVEAAQNTPPAKKRTFVKREEPVPSTTYATQPVQSSSNLLSDIADVAMIANTVRHWNDNERSAGVSSSTREVGYDSSDEPSRSSSWSSSSSSSSDSWSSSSSDSGPSSDW